MWLQQSSVKNTELGNQTSKHGQYWKSTHPARLRGEPLCPDSKNWPKSRGDECREASSLLTFAFFPLSVVGIVACAAVGVFAEAVGESGPGRNGGDIAGHEREKASGWEQSRADPR